MSFVTFLPISRNLQFHWFLPYSFLTLLSPSLSQVLPTFSEDILTPYRPRISNYVDTHHSSLPPHRPSLTFEKSLQFCIKEVITGPPALPLVLQEIRGPTWSSFT